MKKRKKYKYINGKKGVISLFLVVIMLPFLSLITVLIDMGRYNSCMNIMDEIMGVSANSVLADYDSYLQKRFGLYAVDQELDLNNTYQDYLDYNKKVLGNTITLNDSSVTGDYSLADTEVLYNQIMEYSKLNVPTTIAADLLNVFDFLKTLEKKISGLQNMMNMISSTSNMIDSTITLIEDTNTLVSAISNLRTKKQQYESSYTTLNQAVLDIVSFIETEGEKPTVDPDNDSEADELAAAEWETKFSFKRTSYNNAKNAYITKINELTAALTNFNNAMTTCNNDIADLSGKVSNDDISKELIKKDKEENGKLLKDINKSLDDMETEGFSENDSSYQLGVEYRDAVEAEIADLQVQESMINAAASGVDPIISSWKNATNNYSSATVTLQINKLNEVKTNINGLNADDINVDNYKNGLNTSIYKFDVQECVTKEAIENFLKEQDDSTKDQGGFSALLKGFTNVFDSLFKISIFYDADLSACIDINFYNTTFGGLPGGAAAESEIVQLLQAIGDTYTSFYKLRQNIISLKLISALKEIKNLISSIKTLFTRLINFVSGIIHRLIELVTGYDQIYTSMYMAYNLPCRTTLKGKTMSGYSYSNIGLPSQGVVSGLPFIGDIAALVNQINAIRNGTGDDYTFSGAEMEYIFFGSTSEIQNQIYTFVAIYLLRLVLDIVPIVSNTEVQTMAAATTIGYGVVIALIILIEPFLDTVVLVNGGSIPLWKGQIFLTPSGFPGFITNIVTFVSFTTAQKDSIKTNLVNAFGETRDDYDYQETLARYQKDGSTGTKKSNASKGFIDLNYQQYCMLMMAILVSRNEQVARLSNLIQMETYWHYRNNYVFDLRNSYTYINTSSNITMKETMTGLFSNTLFTKDLLICRGY